MCLPLLAEQGRRLRDAGAERLLAAGLLLRQHAACRSATAPHEQVRVFFYGSGAVMGDPHPAADSVPEHLARGQRKIAGALAPHLKPVLR